MRVYTYFRSSTAHRVRIALNLKGLEPEQVFVNLLRGDQHDASYLARNPEGFVPFLEDGDTRLSQSLAIIEYLDRTHPEPPLLPEDPAGAARVRSLALVTACDMHPLTNLRVLKYLKNTLGLAPDARAAWARHWMEAGLAALEARLARERETGRFSHGDRPGLADICLVPQVLAARDRWQIALDPYPTLARIYENCLALPAFAAAMPECQPDSEPPEQARQG